MAEQHHNLPDEKEMIERYLPLVRNVVDRVKINLPGHVDADDLYSVGITGLIAAARNFDHQQQAIPFATYATNRIRGAILDELRRTEWLPRRRSKKRKPVTDDVDLVPKLTKALTDRPVPDDADLVPIITETLTDSNEHAELIQLLSQRIAELPDIPKKLLAMCYFENLTFSEMAQQLGLTEHRVCQIHAQTVLGLRAHITRMRVKEPKK